MTATDDDVGELLAHRSALEALIEIALLRAPPKLSTRRLGASAPSKVLSPKAAAELVFTSMVADDETPCFALLRARRSTTDEAFRLAIEDVVFMQGSVSEPAITLLKKGAHLLDALEAVIRAAICEPDDFLSRGKWSGTCLTLNTKTMEAAIELPLYGEVQRLEYGEPGGHRGGSPYFRRLAVVDGPFFAEVGRLFHRGAR